MSLQKSLLAWRMAVLLITLSTFADCEYFELRIAFQLLGKNPFLNLFLLTLIQSPALMLWGLCFLSK
jgi:hypothetical protein